MLDVLLRFGSDAQLYNSKPIKMFFKRLSLEDPYTILPTLLISKSTKYL